MSSDTPAALWLCHCQGSHRKNNIVLFQQDQEEAVCVCFCLLAQWEGRVGGIGHMTKCTFNEVP